MNNDFSEQSEVLDDSMKCLEYIKNFQNYSSEEIKKFVLKNYLKYLSKMDNNISNICISSSNLSSLRSSLNSLYHLITIYSTYKFFKNIN